MTKSLGFRALLSRNQSLLVLASRANETGGFGRVLQGQLAVGAADQASLMAAGGKLACRCANRFGSPGVPIFRT